MHQTPVHHLSAWEQITYVGDKFWRLIPWIGSKKNRHRREIVVFIIIIVLLIPISLVSPTDGHPDRGYTQALYNGKGFVTIGSFGACFADPMTFASGIVKENLQGAADKGVNKLKSVIGQRRWNGPVKRELAGNGGCTGLSPFGWSIPANIVQKAMIMHLDLATPNNVIRAASVGFSLYFIAVVLIAVAAVFRVVSAFPKDTSKWRTRWLVTSYILVVAGFISFLLPCVVITLAVANAPQGKAPQGTKAVTFEFSPVLLVAAMSGPLMSILLAMMTCGCKRERRERRQKLEKLAANLPTHHVFYPTSEHKAYAHNDQAHKDEYPHEDNYDYQEKHAPHDSHSDDLNRPIASYEHSHAAHRVH